MHLVAEPEEPVDLHLVDMTASQGLYVMVLLPGSGSGKSLPLRDLGPVVPRLARMRKDGIALMTEVDDAALAMFEWTRDELLGRRSLEFIHPDDHVVAIDSWMQMLGAPGLRLRHARKDPSWLWVEITNLKHLDDPDDPHAATEVLDVSEEMAMLEQLRAREELLQKLAEALPNGVMRFERDGRITYVNRRMAEIVGERTRRRSRSTSPAWRTTISFACARPSTPSSAAMTSRSKSVSPPRRGPVSACATSRCDRSPTVRGR